MNRALFSLLLIFHFPALMIGQLEASEPARSLEGEWPGIPGIDGGGITLMNQNNFFILMGSAASSYLIAEFLSDTLHENYYQSRFGVYGVSNNTVIALQSFGIEKRVAPWFGLGVEFILQEWQGSTPSNYSGAGIGLNTYYRWHLLSKYPLSPYLEYGAGVFNGFNKLPYNGSNFTFHLSTSLGLEYNFENRNLLRLSYGHLHQSNNGLFESNPGLDGGGVQVSFLWFWAESKGL